MAKIGDLISCLQIGDTKIKNPEWWKTTHKLKKEIRKEQTFKTNSILNSSYRIVDNKTNITSRELLSDYHSKLDFPRYNIFAPWNPIFKKFKTIIFFK